MWVGWNSASGNHQSSASSVHQVNANADLALICPCAVWGEGSTQGQWQPSSWSHTIHFLPAQLWCLLSCCPFAGAQGECLWAIESLCGPSKSTAWFPAALCLTEGNGYKLGGTRSQGVTRVRWAVFSWLMQIHIWPSLPLQAAWG